jgi:hypothetical protein
MIGLELPSWMVIEIDLPVLAFTAGMTVIAGIAAALETILGKLLPGVSGFVPWSAAPCLLVLITVTLAASAVPAWRISRLDQAVTLRQD